MKHFLLAFALISTAAWANEPAAPTAKHSCVQPELPGKMASDNKRKTFSKRFKEYSECMKKFIDEQNQVMKQAGDAAGAAVNEYNEFAKQVNAENEAQ
jgi:hypothetical protein